MTSTTADNQFGFGAPKSGAGFEVLHNPHLAHLLKVVDEAVGLIERHDTGQTVHVANEQTTKVPETAVVDTQTALDNVYQSYDAQPLPDYDRYERAA